MEGIKAYEKVWEQSHEEYHNSVMRRVKYASKVGREDWSELARKTGQDESQSLKEENITHFPNLECFWEVKWDQNFPLGLTTWSLVVTLVRVFWWNGGSWSSIKMFPYSSEKLCDFWILSLADTWRNKVWCSVCYGVKAMGPKVT